MKAEEISRNRVQYTDSSGKTFIHSKGTWALRNKNPGNIRKPRKENERIDRLESNSSKVFKIVFEKLDNIEAVVDSKLPVRKKNIGFKYINLMCQIGTSSL